MVNLYIFDISFLVVFILFVIFFIRKNKKNTEKQGIMYLYKTQVGVKLMKKFDEKHHKLLGRLRYIILVISYILMIAMIILLAQSFWTYMSQPEITDTIKAPPVAPLIPYFPEIFGMESFFPPFYFIYFLISIAIVTLMHEFSHGLFMYYSKTKIKSTGFLFLGPIFGAFVEQDEKSFNSKSRFNKMSILGAGVFANLIIAIIFLFLYLGFFSLFFAPAGLNFYYPTQKILLSDVHNSYEFGEYTGLIINETNYFIETINYQILVNNNISSEDIFIDAYTDSPIFQSQLKGRITGLGKYEIKDRDDFIEALQNFEPYETTELKTINNEQEQIAQIILQSHPNNESLAYLEFRYPVLNTETFTQKFIAKIMGFKQPSTYYESKINEEVLYFFYDLIWWVMVINILVALFNMLPLGILDGGEFFRLTIEGLANKKVADVSYEIAKWLLKGVFIVMLIIWAIRIFF